LDGLRQLQPTRIDIRQQTMLAVTSERAVLECLQYLPALDVEQMAAQVA